MDRLSGASWCVSYGSENDFEPEVLAYRVEAYLGRLSVYFTHGLPYTAADGTDDDADVVDHLVGLGVFKFVLVGNCGEARSGGK